MKVIPIHNTDTINAWIHHLKQKNKVVQQEVYNYYSPKMLSVCRSYVKDLHHAEDCMIQGFVKVFTNIKSYSFKGNFEGWIRKIMVNECLTFLRLQKKLNFLEEQNIEQEKQESVYEADFDAQQLLDFLSEGYKVVFNLFVLEEYSHKEIAKMLNISENTSKSQLYKAKNKLRELCKQRNINYL